MWPLWLKRKFYRWRYRYFDKVAHSPAAFSVLDQCWQRSSFQSGRDWREQEFLVVDAELSSLDPLTGELLSLGWVVIRNGRIPIASAEHHLLKPKEGGGEGVGQSAVIHQLRDCELAQGLSVAALMEVFLSAAQGRVLVFHHALLDMAFLDQLCRDVYGAPLLMPALDTLQIEKRNLQRRGIPLGQSVLRLANCCARYNLPPSPAHNALTDALATAELLLAQIAHKGRDVCLGDLS